MKKQKTGIIKLVCDNCKTIEVEEVYNSIPHRKTIITDWIDHYGNGFQVQIKPDLGKTKTKVNGKTYKNRT